MNEKISSPSALFAYHRAMRSCPKCEGFVPTSTNQCPHCEHTLAPPRGLSLKAKVVTGLMASSAAMTLMACYGAPCGPDECGFDPGPSCDSEGQASPLDASTLPSMPLVVEGTLTAQPGRNMGSCGGEGDELIYSFTPPAAGSYRMVVESTMDTVLYVRDPDPSVHSGVCGDELECNDESAGSSASELTVTLDGAPVFVVVDNYSASESGDFTLTIEGL